MTLLGTNLSFAYPKGPVVVDAVTATIETGVITAIVGPNGAGKSTLLRLLAGLLRPDSGAVLIDEQPIERMNAHDRAIRLAYIAQRSTLAFDFDVAHVVSFGRLALSKDPGAIDRAIERFGLTQLASRPVGSLSVGQQQRVALARGWAQLDGAARGYLLADEPTSAMDPKHQIQTMDALAHLARRGIGVAIVAHDLSMASRFADRAIVLNSDGTLHTQGAASDALIPEHLSQVFQTPFLSGQLGGYPVLVPSDSHIEGPGADILPHA